MRAVGHRVFRGPNVFADRPVIRVDLDLATLGDGGRPRLGPVFVRRIIEGLGDEVASRLRAKRIEELVDRFDAGETGVIAELFAETALAFQRLAGARATGTQVLPSPHANLYPTLYGYEDAWIGVQVGRLALYLIADCLPGGADSATEGFDVVGSRTDLVRRGGYQPLDITTEAIVDAAEARGIPWYRLVPQRRMVQLGEGRYQRRLFESMSSRTGVLGVMLARNKADTNRFLADLGFPVARQRLVDTARNAVAAAEALGFPVVVKPLSSGKSRGVSVGLTDQDGVAQAFQAARVSRPRVLVESFIPGDDHRMLVVGGRLIAAARREPAQVTGDGTSTVAGLIDRANQDPRRGEGFSNWLVRIDIDAEVRDRLAEQGHHPESVPDKGDVVRLRDAANISAGGTSVDVTDNVHPDNRAMAERAVAALGLDVAGLDFITPDISRSYREVGGGICEVNQCPGLRPHWVADERRDVVTPILDHIVPPGAPARVPSVGLLNSDGSSHLPRLIGRLLAEAGRTVGVMTPDFVGVAGEVVAKGDDAKELDARVMLMDPRIDAAVFAATVEDTTREGLPFTHCAVGVVAPDGADTETDERVTAARVLASVTSGAMIVAIDDPDAPALPSFAEQTGGRPRIWYVSDEPSHPRLQDHLRAGGAAVVVEAKGSLTTYTPSGREHVEVSPAAVPDDCQAAPMQIALAVAAAQALARQLGDETASGGDVGSPSSAASPSL